MSETRRIRAAVIATSAIAVTLQIAARIDPLQPGLHATFFADTAWSSAPIRSLVAAPSTETLTAGWDAPRPSSYSATWTGALFIARTDDYVLAIASDDGAWLYVDGKRIVDNGGRHARQVVSTRIRLARGVHDVFIQYFQDGGSEALELLWARGDEALTPVPEWALSPRRTDFARLLASVVLRRAALLALAVWLATIAAAAAATLRSPIRRTFHRVRADPWLQALTAIVIASTILNAIGITWGLPSAWMGDELTPRWVVTAIGKHFAGGWFTRYPPLHYYVLSVADAPWLLMKSIGWVHPPDPEIDPVLFVVGRLVSVCAAAATLVAVYACGAHAFGRPAGVLAAAMLAVWSPFVFYAKAANTDIPYGFWFALSLWFYVRALDSLAPRDIFFLFVTAAAAVTTKDQAYATYVSIPIVLAYRLRRAGRPLADWRLWTGPAAAAIVFVAVHNIPFNVHGFVDHLRDITGPGRDYQMFPRTMRGELELFAFTLDLDRRSWGWPLALLSAIGAVAAVRDRSRRRYAGPLMLTAVTYYLTFVALVLYNYDRFLLPIAIVQALVGGVAIDRLLVEPARWRRAAAFGVFAYTALYAATIDVLMWRDSRYAAERWLHDRVPRGALVATVFAPVVEPRLQEFDNVDIGTVGQLRRFRPDYFVLNADYARAVPRDTELAPLIDGLRQQTLGYRLVYRYRTPPPWPWLPAPHPDLVGARDDLAIASFLRNINPTIEIFQLDDAPPTRGRIEAGASHQ